MQELIKVTTNEQGSQVVSARELHKFLENTDNVNTWFKRQSERAMLEENQDFTSVAILQTSGQKAIDYAITLQAAKEIAMLNGGNKGKQARIYFIECEKKLKETIKVPTTFKEALKLALEQQELIEQQQQQIENLDTVLDNLLDWVSIIKIAKFNKVSEKNFEWRKLKKKSEELGYLIKKAESPRYGFQNLYHIDCFKACYPQYNYNIK